MRMENKHSHLMRGAQTGAYVHRPRKPYTVLFKILTGTWRIKDPDFKAVLVTKLKYQRERERAEKEKY